MTGIASGAMAAVLSDGFLYQFRAVTCTLLGTLIMANQ